MQVGAKQAAKMKIPKNRFIPITLIYSFVRSSDVFLTSSWNRVDFTHAEKYLLNRYVSLYEACIFLIQLFPFDNPSLEKGVE
jgi:hypothetical protein